MFLCLAGGDQDMDGDDDSGSSEIGYRGTQGRGLSRAYHFGQKACSKTEDIMREFQDIDHTTSSLSGRPFADHGKRLKTRLGKVLKKARIDGRQSKANLGPEQQELANALDLHIKQMSHCRALMGLYADCLDGNESAVELGDRLLDVSVTLNVPVPPNIVKHYASLKAGRVSADFESWVDFTSRVAADVGSRSAMDVANGVVEEIACSALLAKVNCNDDGGEEESGEEEEAEDMEVDDAHAGPQQRSPEQQPESAFANREFMVGILQWLSPLLPCELQAKCKQAAAECAAAPGESECESCEEEVSGAPNDEAAGPRAGAEEKDEGEESDFEAVLLSQENPDQAVDPKKDASRPLSPIELLRTHWPTSCAQGYNVLAELLLMVLGTVEFDSGKASALADKLKLDSENAVIRRFVTTPFGLQVVASLVGCVNRASEAAAVRTQLETAVVVMRENLMSVGGDGCADFEGLSQWLSRKWKSGKDLVALASLLEQAGKSKLDQHPVLHGPVVEAQKVAMKAANLPASQFAEAFESMVKGLGIEELKDVDFGSESSIPDRKTFVASLKDLFDAGVPLLQRVHGQQSPMSKMVNSTDVGPLVDWCKTWLEGLAACVSMQTHGSGCADLSSKHKRCQALISSPPSGLGFGQSTVDALDVASRAVQHVAQATVTACEQQAFAVFKSAVEVEDLDWPACFEDDVVPWRDTNADARAAVDGWASKSTVEASILTELLVHIDDSDDATKCECLVAMADFKIMWSRAAKKVWQVLGTPCETEIYPTALCQSLKDLSTAMVKVQSFIDSRSATHEGQSPLATAAQKRKLLDLGDIVSQVATDAESCSTRYEALLDSIAKHGESIVQSLMDAAQAEFQADFMIGPGIVPIRRNSGTL